MLYNVFLRHPRPFLQRHRLLRREWRRREGSAVRVAALLEESFRAKDHVGQGWGRFDDFAEHEWGIPRRQAWTYLRIGQRLRELPKTRAALLNEAIGYTKVREFLSLATVDNEEEWLAFAAAHSSRALERRVHQERTRSGDEKEHIAGWYDGLEVQAIEQAWHELKRESGQTFPLSGLLPRLSARYLEGKLPRGRRKLLGFTVVQVCPVCLDTWIPVRTGNLRIAVDRLLERLRDPSIRIKNFLGEQLCACKGPKHRADRCPADEGNPLGATTRSLTRFIRREVIYGVWLRDGGRCRVPDCTTSGSPENFHIVAFREGGPSEKHNLVTVCSHHNDLYEQGVLRVDGRAPFEAYRLNGEFLGYGFRPDSPERPGDRSGTFEEQEPVSHGGHSPPGRQASPPATG